MSRRPQLFGKTLFVDLMMGTLVVVTHLLQVSNAIEKAKQGKQAQDASLRTEGVYAVVMTWPDGSRDDVDLYVMDPAGETAYFHSPDVGLMHLEHDDLGSRSDTVMTSTGEVKIDTNEERTIIRGVIPGEYVVNVHMYRKEDPRPTPVTISLYRLRGTDTEIVKKTRTLSKDGDEETAFRFSLAADGSVSGINELPRRIIGAVAAPRGGGLFP